MDFPENNAIKLRRPRQKGEKMQKKNKKLFRIPVSHLRVAMLALLFILNAVIFALLVAYGAKYLWIYTALELLSIIITVVLIARNDNPAYKVAWIVVIMALPIFGICIYLVFGVNSLKKADMMRLAKIESKYTAEVQKNLHTLPCALPDSERARTQAKYLENTASALAFGKSETKYYPLGDLAFPDMLEIAIIIFIRLFS